MKRTVTAFLLAGLLIFGSGCVHCGSVYQPFGPGTLCTGVPCDDGCGGCATPSCTSCAAPACCTACSAPTPAACSCETACDPCGDPCSGSCAPCGPLTWLFSVLNAGYCGDGCGDIWWGDFHSAPPECCEPCNRLGQWTGGGLGVPITTGGCSSCGDGQTIDYTFHQQPRVLAGPTPAPAQQAAKPISTVTR